jgi:hypothetical protein
MDADPAVSAHLVPVALSASRSHPPPALSCHMTRAGPPPVGPVRSTPERTYPFFPKWRSVGPEPGRTLFFLIERTGPPGGGPARFLFPVRCPHPSHSRPDPGRGISCSHPPACYKPCDPFTSSPFCAIPRHRISIVVDIPARAGQRPDAFPRDTLTRATLPAAPPQALRAIRTDRSTPPSCSVPLPHSFSPSGWNGECISRPMMRVGPAIPPPTPTPAHGTRCPPLGRAAASASGAISVLPDFSVSLPSVHSPLHRGLSDSAPLFSALPACQIDQLVPTVANPRQDRSWTPIQRFPPILSSSLWTRRAPTRRRLPSPLSRDTGRRRAAAGRAGSFNSGKNIRSPLDQATARPGPPAGTARACSATSGCDAESESYSTGPGAGSRRRYIM